MMAKFKSNMNSTGMEDRNGREICLGDTVILGAYWFEVIVNDFNKQIVVDGDTGQSPLIDVHMECEVVA